ncbi:hypothetical protein ACF0H5_016056 [Mactra antiquata]
MSYTEPGIHMQDRRPESNPYFPTQVPHQPNTNLQHNNGYVSPPTSVLDARMPSLPNTAGTSRNMQMSASPHVQSNATSPVSQKHPNVSSPVAHHPVNGPVAAMHGIPSSISSNITPHISPMHHMGPTIPPVFPPISSNSLPNIPHVPSLPNIPGISERTMNEFRTPDQFPLTPHHPLPHYPSMHPHSHMTHRDTSLFGDPTRMPPMNINTPNHLETLSRGPNDSSCMYHPGLSYSVPGHLQPSGPSFISGATEMNPFRSNFLNSFPTGYSYPPDRYRDGFGSLGFPRLGMPSSAAAFSQYAGQGYGMGNTFSQQYLNSQHGCPKNGSRPPVSPSTDDVKVLQEGYLNDENIKRSKVLNAELRSPKSSTNSESDTNKSRSVHKEKKSSWMSNNNELLSPKIPGIELSPRMEHMRAWADFYLNRSMSRDESEARLRSVSRSDSTSSSRSSLWEPWKMASWYSPRRDEVRSHASTSTLSDFECEVISVDDHQLNALIRSDGCNSLEIEFDNRSLCSGDESSPRKVLSRNSFSDLSPWRGNSFEPIDKVQAPLHESRLSLIHTKCVPHSNISQTGITNKSDVPVSKCNISMNKNHSELKQTKHFIDGLIIIRQELDDEGTLQLEIPGTRVTIEDTVLDKQLQMQCSNIVELKEYLENSRTSSPT